MALNKNLINQLLEQTEEDLEKILTYRIYQFGLSSMKKYIMNQDLDVSGMSDFLIGNLEELALKVDMYTETLPLMREQMKSGNITFDFNEFEDNFYRNIKTVKNITDDSVKKETSTVLKEISTLYKEIREIQGQQDDSEYGRDQ